MKKSKIFIVIIAIVIVLTFIYKLLMLNKYKTEYVKIDTASIFNDKLTISETNQVKSDEALKEGKMQVKNYFTDFKDIETSPDFKAKYDENGKIIAFYSITSMPQYIDILNENSLKLFSTEENYREVATSKYMKNFLKKNKINNDVDFLYYIKNNYYLKNSIFSCVKTMKINYLINSFAQIALPEFKSITLIDGKIQGYIINTNSNIREIRVLYNKESYIILLSGEIITTDEFINDLLKTISFEN